MGPYHRTNPFRSGVTSKRGSSSCSFLGLLKMENLPERENKISISKSNKKANQLVYEEITVNNKEKIFIIIKLILKNSSVTKTVIYTSNFDQKHFRQSFK